MSSVFGQQAFCSASVSCLERTAVSIYWLHLFHYDFTRLERNVTCSERHAGVKVHLEDFVLPASRRMLANTQ